MITPRPTAAPDLPARRWGAAGPAGRPARGADDTEDDAGGALFFSEGILTGTQIATDRGWCAAGALSPGDLVQTFDNGLCRLVEVHRAVTSVAPCDWPLAHWPLRVPRGAMGNADDLRLLPGQPVLLESDLCDDRYGDPFALVPARALEDWQGIAPERPGDTESAVVLIFDEDQVVYARSSVLLFCPGLAGQALTPDREAAAPYHALSLPDARDLVAALIALDPGPADADPGCAGQAAAAAWPPNRP